ncbi:MAG: hypothetical protein ACRC7N_08935 [Clostridium sp.]
MEEKLNKLEFMLMGLRQMQVGAVCAWFPHEKKEDIIKAIEASPKFKIEGNIVSLKSETEKYEEELQKNILRELDGEENLSIGQEFSLYDDDDDDLNLVELVGDSNSNDNLFVLEETIPNIQEASQNVIVEEAIESNWIEAQAIADEISTIEIEEIVQAAPVVEEPKLEEYYNEEGEYTMEQVQPVVNNVNGTELGYEDILKIIEEYNNKIEAELSYASDNSFDVKVKAIKTFYQNKYNVKLKEENILNANASVFALINRKKGVEAAYLLICETLEADVLAYMLDNYDDEVVYFCPIDGSKVEFEVGLNEFYLKDTDIIFDKYLEHYVITEEKDFKVKKLEIVIGSK